MVPSGDETDAFSGRVTCLLLRSFRMTILRGAEGEVGEVESCSATGLERVTTGVPSVDGGVCCVGRLDRRGNTAASAEVLCAVAPWSTEVRSTKGSMADALRE